MSGEHPPGAALRVGRSWSREDIVLAIRAWTALYGAVPAMLDWDVYRARRAGHHWRVDRYLSGDWPSCRTVCTRFGNFSAAMRAAGLEPRPQGVRRTRTPPAPPASAFTAIKTSEAGFRAALSSRVRDVAAAHPDGSPEELRYALFSLARQALSWAESLQTDLRPARPES